MIGELVSISTNFAGCETWVANGYLMGWAANGAPMVRVTRDLLNKTDEQGTEIEVLDDCTVWNFNPYLA